MKRPTAIFIWFIIIGLIPWQVQSGEKDQLELAFQIVEKSRISKTFVDLSESFMETYFEQYETAGRQDSANANPLKKLFKEEVNLGEHELKWMLAEIYAANFSENDLRAILAFFNSAAGSAWLEKKLLIQTESEQVGLEWCRLLNQRVLNKFETQYGEKF